MRWLQDDGVQKRPIAVSDATKYGRPGYFLIHDGHHRTESLKRLGCRFIMANVIDFADKRYRVLSWLTSQEFSKKVIIESGLNGMKLASNMTKHVVEANGELLPFHDNDEIEPVIPTALEELK